MREPTYFILAALLDGPLHGYAISMEAREASNGRVKLTAGTLYGALDRLRDQGLLAVDREETVSGRPRRYYVLTDAGRQTLAKEAEQKLAAARLVLRAATA